MVARRRRSKERSGARRRKLEVAGFGYRRRIMSSFALLATHRVT